MDLNDHANRQKTYFLRCNTCDRKERNMRVGVPGLRNNASEQYSTILAITSAAQTNPCLGIAWHSETFGGSIRDKQRFRREVHLERHQKHAAVGKNGIYPVSLEFQLTISFPNEEQDGTTRQSSLVRPYPIFKIPLVTAIVFQRGHRRAREIHVVPRI